MKLLLDESMPKRLGSLLPDHEVSTAALEGWAGTGNGKLLALASNKFDAFITADQNLGYQQNLNALPLSVVVLVAYSNKLAAYQPLVPKLQSALCGLQPCSYVTVRE